VPWAEPRFLPSRNRLAASVGPQVHWFQVQFVHPVIAWWIDTVLGTWEETLKALVREVTLWELSNHHCPGCHSWLEVVIARDDSHGSQRIVSPPNCCQSFAQVFAKCTRFINGVCGWVVALFRLDRTQYRCEKQPASRLAVGATLSASHVATLASRCLVNGESKLEPAPG